VSQKELPNIHLIVKGGRVERSPTKHVQSIDVGALLDERDYRIAIMRSNRAEQLGIYRILHPCAVDVCVYAGSRYRAAGS
jgi:hypothetical protein